MYLSVISQIKDKNPKLYFLSLIRKRYLNIIINIIYLTYLILI